MSLLSLSVRVRFVPSVPSENLWGGKLVQGYKNPPLYDDKILHTIYASWHNGREFNGWERGDE